MKKKLLMILTITLCAVALVAGSVIGTIAYLRDSAFVINVFTSGEVEITLDETKISDDGIHPVADGARTTSGNEYKLMPGLTYVKDPVIHILPDCEDAYLFLRVENPLTPIEAASNTIDTDNDAEGTLDNKTIHDQLVANGWVLMSEKVGEVPTYGTGSNIYRYTGGVNGIVERSTTEQKIDTFKTFTVDSDETGETLAPFSKKSVVVVVYAVQAEGHADYKEAAAEFIQDFKNPILTGGN